MPTREYGYRGGQLLVTVSNGDAGRLTRFVQNLYNGALQRDPTTQELSDKTNELASAGAHLLRLRMKQVLHEATRST